MANISILRKSVAFDEQLGSYRMTIEVTVADGITSKIFVNQRLRNFVKNNFEDVFVAVATPAQIEDFAEDAPLEGSSYFRTNKIDVISRNYDYLESVFDDIVWNIQKLITDQEALSILETDGTYTITSDDITIE